MHDRNTAAVPYRGTFRKYSVDTLPCINTQSSRARAPKKDLDKKCGGPDGLRSVIGSRFGFIIRPGSYLGSESAI